MLDVADESSGLCSAGTSENFTLVGSTRGWRCNGIDGGTGAVCLESKCQIPQ